MKYKEYRFLKKLYELSPQIDDEQKYKSYFVNTVQDKTKLSIDDVLSLATKLSQDEFVSICKNKEGAPERSGYIHLMRITYKGVSAMKEYKTETIWNILRNIIIPAIVSIIVSFICA